MNLTKKKIIVAAVVALVLATIVVLSLVFELNRNVDEYFDYDTVSSVSMEERVGRNEATQSYEIKKTVLSNSDVQLFRNELKGMTWRPIVGKVADTGVVVIVYFKDGYTTFGDNVLTRYDATGAVVKRKVVRFGGSYDDLLRYFVVEPLA